MPDWMKVEKDTPEKPEILALGTILGIHPDEAFGKCFKVWRWADSHTTDGYVRRVTNSEIDRLAGMNGFADALVEVGWLHVRTGALQVPNFDRHMGQSAKTRALTSNRMERSRQRKSDAASVTEPSPEKRREEKSKGRDPPLPPLPAELDTLDFRDAWAEWIQYRKERKPKLTPTGAKRTLAELAGWGPARAAAAIRHTIAKGWQGIREPDRDRRGEPQPSAAQRTVANLLDSDFLPENGDASEP